MDLVELKKSEKYEVSWMNPQTENILIIKYVQPWQWADYVMFTQSNIEFLNVIQYPFAMLHDISLFPNVESATGSLYDNLMTKLPPVPPNLKSIIVVNPRKNAMMEVGFDIVQSIFLRKKIVFFVDTMDKAKDLLVHNELM